MIHKLFALKIDIVAFIIIMAIIIAGLLPPFMNIFVYESEYGYFRLLDIVCILSGLIIIIHYINRKTEVSKSWIILLIITGLVTIINSIDNIDMSVMIITWLSFIMTTAVAVYKPNIEDGKYILYTILFVCIVNILFGLIIFIGGDYLIRIIAPNYYLTHARTQPFCILGGPIILSFLCLITMVVASLLWKDQHPTFIALSNTFLLLLSVLWASRSGFLAVLATYIIIYWKGYRKYVLLPIAILLLAVFIASSTYVQEETRFMVWDFSDKSSLWRYTAAIYVMDKIKEHYLLGTGPGIIFNRGDRDKFADIITKSNVPLIKREGYLMPTEPHNTYLLFFLEYGLAGISIFIFFIINILKKSESFEYHFEDNYYYQLSFIIIFVIYGLSESLMYNLRFAILLWSCMAILHIEETNNTQSVS